MIPLPDAIDTDGDDVIWALQTASTLWKRGELNEALVWVKRAAKAADAAGDAERAVTLGRALDELDATRPPAPAPPNETPSEPNLPVSAAAMLLLATTQTSVGVSARPVPTPAPSSEGSFGDDIEVVSAISVATPAAPPGPPPAAVPSPASPAPPAASAAVGSSPALPPPRPPHRTDPLFTPAFGAVGVAGPAQPVAGGPPSTPPPSSDALEEINELDVELSPASEVEPKPAAPPRKPTMAPGRPPPHPLASTAVSPSPVPPPSPAPANAPPAVQVVAGSPAGPPPRVPSIGPRAPSDAGIAPLVIPPPGRLPSVKDATLPPPRPAAVSGHNLAAIVAPDVVIRDDRPAADSTTADALDGDARGASAGATIPTPTVLNAPAVSASSPPAPLAPPRPRSVPPPPRPQAETKADASRVRLDVPGGPADPSVGGSMAPQPSRTLEAKADARASHDTPDERTATRMDAPSANASSTPSSRPQAPTLPEIPETIPLSQLPLSSVPVPIPSLGGQTAKPSSKVATIPPPNAEEAVEVDVEVEAPPIARQRRPPRPLTGLQLLDPWSGTDHVVTSAPALSLLTDTERESSLPPEPVTLGSFVAATPPSSAFRPSVPPDAEPLSDDEIIGDDSASATPSPVAAPAIATTAGPAPTQAPAVETSTKPVAPPLHEVAPDVVDVEAPRATPPEPVASRRTHPPPTAGSVPPPVAQIAASDPPPASPPDTASDTTAPPPASAPRRSPSEPSPSEPNPPVSRGPSSSAPVELTGDEPFGPLILDSVGAFTDLPRDVRRKFAHEGRVVTLGAGEAAGDFALAYVHRGSVDITAVVHDTPVTALERGSVLRSVASIEPCPRVRLVANVAETIIVLWDETAFSAAFQACTWVEDDLRVAATRPLALVGAITGPLSDRLDERHLREVLVSLELRLLAPNEVLVEQGDVVEGVALVGCGELQRLKTGGEVETFPSGAFLLADEVLSAARAKGTVRAGAGGAAVFVLDRKKTQEIVMMYPPVLEILAGM